MIQNHHPKKSPWGKPDFWRNHDELAVIRDSDYHTFCTPLLFLHQSKTAGAKWILTWVSYRFTADGSILLQLLSTWTNPTVFIPNPRGHASCNPHGNFYLISGWDTGTHHNPIPKKKSKFQPNSSRKWHFGNLKTLLLLFWGKGGPGFPFKKKTLKGIGRLMVFDGDESTHWAKRFFFGIWCQLQIPLSSRKFHNTYMYMCTLPRTQMTLILIGKGLVLGVDLQKWRSLGF